MYLNRILWMIQKKLDDPGISVKYFDIKPPVQDSAVEIS